MNYYNLEILEMYFHFIHILSNSSSSAAMDWQSYLFEIQTYFYRFSYNPTNFKNLR